MIRAGRTAIYPNRGNNFIYPTLGLVGEAGEIAEKVKKVLRDKQGIIDNATRVQLVGELGDVLWYVSQLAYELGVDLDEVAMFNLDKLTSRKARNKLHGEGDNR